MKSSGEYWYARRYPLGSMRTGMAPVHWKGWALTMAFVAALALAGALFWWFAQRDEVVKGVAVFGVSAAGAGLGFIRVAHIKGDHINCVADYRKGKLSA